MGNQTSRSFEATESDDRKVYEAPQLTVHGKMEDLTAGSINAAEKDVLGDSST